MRTRQQWAALVVTVIRPVSTALAHAAQAVTAQAREQRDASESGAVVTAPRSGAAGSGTRAGGAGSSTATATAGSSDALADRLRSLSDVLASLPDAAKLALVG